MTVFNNINIAIAFVGIGGIIGQIMAKRKTKILKTDSYESNGYILIHGTVSKICPKTKNWTVLSVHKRTDVGSALVKTVGSLDLTNGPHTIYINNYPLFINSNSCLRIIKSKSIIPISIARHYFEKNQLIIPVDYSAHSYEIRKMTLNEHDTVLAITSGNTIIALTDKYNLDDCLEDLYGYSPGKVIVYTGLVITSLLKLLLT